MESTNGLKNWILAVRWRLCPCYQLHLMIVSCDIVGSMVRTRATWSRTWVDLSPLVSCEY